MFKLVKSIFSLFSKKKEEKPKPIIVEISATLHGIGKVSK